MSQRRNPRSTRVAGLLGALIAGCGSTGTPPVRALGDALVVPAGEGGYYVFRADAIERRDANELGEHVFAVPTSAGRPAVAGVDPFGGWAAVAYEHALYSIQLAEGRVIPIASATWTAPPSVIGVRGKLAATLEDRRVGLYRVADGERAWSEESDRFLQEGRLDQVYFVQPLSTERFLLVGFRETGLLSHPSTIVLEVDRRGGGAKVPREQPITALHQLGACSSDGKSLYLAGASERESRGPGRNSARLEQTLLVVCVDPDRLDQRVVVSEISDRSFRVRQIATGFGLVAVCLEGGFLRVYQDTGASATRTLHEARYAGEISAACIDETHVVVTSGEMAKRIEIHGVVHNEPTRSVMSGGGASSMSNSMQPIASGSAHNR